MTTEQKEQFTSMIAESALLYESTPYQAVIAFVEQLEKQAAIDALAKAERIEEAQGKFRKNIDGLENLEQRYLAICAQRGTFATYLTNFIDQMTPDQREIIAIQFDQNLFGTDKAMADRFRKANNTSHENN